MADMRELVIRDCPNCGGLVSAFARSCAYCGAPNKARKKSLAVAGTIGGLLVVVGLTALLALGGSWRLGSGEQPQATADNFAWLSSAMQACDAEAEKNPGTLYFIVIPLKANPDDSLDWRTKSLNDIGNGILLRGAIALDGLKDQSLNLSTVPYVFNIRDQSGIIYKWKQSSGVKRFSTDDADAIITFNIQFLIGAKPRDSAWGTPFTRQKTCYWVNAIIES